MILKAEVWQEEGMWCASVPALKGCHTCADSFDSLKINLKEAIELWIESMNSMNYKNEILEIAV